MTNKVNKQVGKILLSIYYVAMYMVSFVSIVEKWINNSFGLFDFGINNWP